MKSQYVDSSWLNTFALNDMSVLDYFYTCPFYDKESNNEVIRSQGISISHLSALVGTEFAVDYSLSKGPSLYIIYKQQRSSPVDVEVMEVFYVLEGIIYQSPSVADIVRSRIDKASLAVKSSFEGFNDSVASFARDYRAIHTVAESTATAPVVRVQTDKYSALVRDLEGIDFG